MSPKEFADEMRKINEDPDVERKHAWADSLMCEQLKELGYSEGIKIFEKMNKWYA